MQGTAADIIKRAMIVVDGWLREDEVDARIIMQVHDDLVLEARAGEAENIGEAVRSRMVAAATLNVALEVYAGIVIKLGGGALGQENDLHYLSCMLCSMVSTMGAKK